MIDLVMASARLFCKDFKQYQKTEATFQQFFFCDGPYIEISE
jgi:site-specific DNA-adenine methylase